jgi:hypothetical protein
MQWDEKITCTPLCLFILRIVLLEAFFMTKDESVSRRPDYTISSEH